MTILAWGIGVSLWAHVVNHFGVTYFGQIWMGWYLVLGIIGSMAASAPLTACIHRHRRKQPPVSAAASPMEPGVRDPRWSRGHRTPCPT
jgi:hypothetical protein